MAVILDANAVINLYHAGLLPLVYHEIGSIIPAEVYEEAINGGRQAGHADAEGIAEIIGEPTEPPTAILPELARMGDGEAAALSRYMERGGYLAISDDVIVSDDQQFLRYLRRRIENDRVEIRHMTTAGLIASFVLDGSLSRSQALEALARISSRMPEDDHQEALRRLETL